MVLLTCQATIGQVGNVIHEKLSLGKAGRNKKHIGIYPPVTQDAALVKELSPYRGEKGNLSFPLDQPLPIDLIGRVAVALHQEYECK